MFMKYYFGNLSIDGDTVGFGEFEEPETISGLNLVEQFLLTEEFDVNNNTEFLVTIGSMLNITNPLTGTAFMKFSLELVDAANDEVLGIYYPYEVNQSSQNSTAEQNYLISTDGIGNKTVKLRVKASTNLDNDYFISTVVDFDGRANKRDYVEIDYAGELEISSYDIAQNYPNPFNPVTTIKYQLPESGVVTLKIYDVLGREIETLVSEYLEKGSYSAEFNGEHLASGVYLYSIKVNDYSAVKKMMLLK
ncbi:MAG: hypothetical protein SCALA702_02020 [Melioribacteraceae bacterium]|nr:MAG: hypothetical protein SCALA702_02020 [Melioribacteraceae bacterium]